MTNKPKNLFNNLASYFRYPETKTFVAFRLEGEGRPLLRQVADRDIKTLEIPPKAAAFFFFDCETKPGRAYDDASLLRRAAHESETYYFADRLLSQREFQNLGYEEQHKLTGFHNQSSWEDTWLAIEGNDVRCMNSRWHPREVAINRDTRARLFPPARPN